MYWAMWMQWKLKYLNNEGESKLASVIVVLVLLEVGSTGVGSDDVL